MKWYLLLHLVNLYVLPAAGYFILLRIYGVVDFVDYGMCLLFGYIPSGCFLISFIYGLRKRTSFLWYCFVCSLFCIPLSFPHIVAGDGLINHIHGGMTLYSAYFLMAFAGSMAGLMIFLGYKAIKKLWKSLKGNSQSF